jgi:hypothetical protein
MRSITAVELGADICAFARTSVRGGEIRLTAAELLDPAAFPGIEAFTLAARQTRKSLGLPRRCRVVVWGLPDGASRRDAAVKPLIEPLIGAGFRVERVVSPCNALAALARRMKTSRGEGSTCWIAINRGGVAIVVVRPGKLLYSHSFAWDSSVGSSGSQARLLQRYSLVSFLAPEIKRAMSESRKFGTPVDAVVTCGNLPELRSLTMPLIEELDVEVETLDSLEGLVVKPQVAEKLAEFAPAIRIACAAAIARGTRPWDPSKKTKPWNTAGAYGRMAALAAVLGAIGYLWYMKPATVKGPAAPTTAKAPAPAPKSNPPAVTAPTSASRIEGRGSLPELPPNPASAKATAGPPKPSAKAEGGSYTDGRGAVGVPVPAPKPTPPAVSAPATAAKSNPPPVVSVPAPAPKPTPPVVNAPATASKSTPPPVSAAAKAPKSNPPTPKTTPSVIPWKPAVVTPPPAVTAPNTKAPPPTRPAPAPPVTARKPESAPPAVSAPPKRPESNPPAKPAPVNATNTVPRARLQPLVTVPSPNTARPSAPVAAPTLASVPAPGVIATTPPPRVTPPPATTAAAAPRPNPPAVSDSAKRAESNPPALNPPAPAADKPATGTSFPASSAPRAASVVQTAAVQTAPAVQRGPMPALIRDAVPRVTAILVARDRRFATIDGGQIIGIGDLLGRRTVVGMDERSVVLQEPSGVQIRIGLGGRLLGVERAAR